MVTYEELAERVARDICDGNWDAKSLCETPSGETPEEFRAYWMDKAKAAMSTIREALSEPNADMISDGIGELYFNPDEPDEEAERVWKAMLEVSPLVEDERKAVSNENSGENDRCPY